MASNPPPPALPIRIAIVEDDSTLREDLREFLGRERDFTFAGACGSAEEALQKIPGLHPDVVLMDINLPGLDGVVCVARLKEALPQTQFMMLTVYEDHDRLFRSLQAGASGYLLKRTPPAQIISAIRELHAGGSPITPQIARRIVQHYQNAPSQTDDVGTLTPHQRLFLDQLAKGYRYKEIADNLGLTMDGVRGNVRRIYDKLHVHSRTEAVMKYLGQSGPGGKNAS
jgi:DNA-binding NarL/FixJ family response regulator